MTSGDFLRKRREVLGWSLREAGEHTEPPLSARYLHDLESGKTQIHGVDKIRQLSEAYRLPVLDILQAFEITTEFDEKNMQALNIGKRILNLPNPGQAIEFVEFLEAQQTPTQSLGNKLY